jgi:hypothetical protein
VRGEEREIRMEKMKIEDRAIGGLANGPTADGIRAAIAAARAGKPGHEIVRAYLTEAGPTEPWRIARETGLAPATVMALGGEPGFIRVEPTALAVGGWRLGVAKEPVKAPGQLSGDRFVTDRGVAVVTGAWQTTRVALRAWVTEFAGTHQRVPFRAIGRTAGRSLRAMRKVLDAAQIPAL